MDFGILGPLEVRVDGRVVRLGGAMPRGVLAVLLLHANRPVSPERLVTALWGEDAPHDAVRALRIHVSRLRKALGDGTAITTTPAGYELSVASEALDAERFERLAAAGGAALRSGDAATASAHLGEALALWRGPVLADLPDLGGPDAARLEEERVAATESYFEAELAVGHLEPAIAGLEAFVAAHPTRERAVAQLMQALYRDGRQADALDAYQRARTHLAEDLGLEPAPALRAMQARILQQDAALGEPSPGSAPPPATLSRPPAPPTVTVGRDADIQEVAGRLRDGGDRLLTLVGPGGVGKTRVAIEVSRALSTEFADGVHFVPLAPVADPGEVAAATARALRVELLPRETPQQALRRFLEAKHALLVLDNFEHVVPAGELLSDLLDAAPQLSVMTTSREPLALAPETRRAISPLGEDDAIALFTARASARDPTFAVDEPTHEAVAEICHRLDGLPLAIELAAARMELLTAVELAERLRVALGDLGSAARGAPERQRTLEATVAWSYGLLEPAEQRCFAEFAVFTGGATVAACEAILGADLEALQSLVTKNLLLRTRTSDGRSRITMLETIRAFALARLGDDDELRERHARHFLAHAERHGGERALCGPERGLHQMRLNAEDANLAAALRWATEHERTELALRIAAAVGVHWLETSRVDQLSRIDAAVALPDVASHPGPFVAAALARVAALRPAGRIDDQLPALERALAVAEATGDAGRRAACLTVGAEVLIHHRDFARAREYAEAARRLAIEAGDEWEHAKAGVWRTVAADSPSDGEIAESRSELRGLGNLRFLCVLLYSVAYGIIPDGRVDLAVELVDEAASLAELLGGSQLKMMVAGNRGLAYLLAGDAITATTAFRDELVACRELVRPALVYEALGGLAAIAAARRDDVRAARLLGASRAHRFGNPPDLIDALLERDYFSRARERSRAWARDERAGAQLDVWAAAREGLDGD